MLAVSEPFHYKKNVLFPVSLFNQMVTPGSITTRLTFCKG